MPIHGLLAAAAGWSVDLHEDAAEGPRLVSTFDFAAQEDLMTVFPFPHQLRVEAGIADETLTIATTVRASGDVPVPIAFGYHPYLRLPGVERSAWLVEIPVSERVVLDSEELPTGEWEPADVAAGPLGRGPSTTSSLPRPSRSPSREEGAESKCHLVRATPMRRSTRRTTMT